MLTITLYIQLVKEIVMKSLGLIGFSCFNIRDIKEALIDLKKILHKKIL